MPGTLFHFSEDPHITRFVPHVPRTNPEQRPAVWAIDAAHAPLYWFPRDCPRVTVWPRTDANCSHFSRSFRTVAPRVHAIELSWLPAMRSARLYRYSFEPHHFASWPEATGQWVSHAAVDPIAVEPVGDLLDRHIEGGIELRAVPSLWPLHDDVVAGGWAFGMVRMRNAAARPT